MEQGDEISIRELIDSIKEIKLHLFQKWKVILWGGILGATLGISISFLVMPKYIGSLKFAIEEENKGGGLANLASSLGFSTGGMGGQSLFSSSSIIELLQTRSIVEKALLRPVRENPYSNQTYADFYIKENSLDKRWRGDSISKNVRFKIGEERHSFYREKNDVLNIVYKQIIEEELSIYQPNKENSIIVINVASKSEVFSKNFPVELIEVASEYYTELKTTKGKSSVDILQHQADSIQSSLYASMGGSATSLDKVFGLNPSMNVQRVPAADGQTKVQINVAILQELVKSLEMAKLNLLNNTPLINIIDRPIYPLEEERIGRIKGMIIGGIVALLLTISYILANRWIEKALHAEETITKNNTSE